MTNRSKVAFALVEDLIIWVLTPEDSTLNYSVMCVFCVFVFFFSHFSSLAFSL